MNFRFRLRLKYRMIRLSNSNRPKFWSYPSLRGTLVPKQSSGN